MGKLIDGRLPGLSHAATRLPKLYPYFRLYFYRSRPEWRDRETVTIVGEDSVINIIFKKIYSVRQREVSGECREHETRHDG